jgi:hypothetical protein
MTADEWRAHVARLAAMRTAIQGRTDGWLVRRALGVDVHHT